MKKSLLIFCEAFGGGVFTVIRDQVFAIKSSSFDVDISIAYCARPETPTDIELRFPGCEMIAMSARREDGLLNLLNEFRKIVNAREFDAVHLHSSFSGFIGRIALIKKKCRVFYTPHCFAFLDNSKNIPKRLLYLFVELFLARIGVVVSCGDTEHRLSRSIGARSILIRNGVGFNGLEFRCAESEDKTLDFVSAGRICAQKGFDDFSKIVNAYSGKKNFLWVGGGSDRKEPYVTGWVDRNAVVGYLKSSKLYVSTAKWEGLPVTPIEAQFLGLPVIALKAPGVNDVVLDGITGFLCDSIADVEAKINYLLVNPSVLFEMSAAAKSFVAERFSLKNYNALPIAYFE